MVTVIVLTYNGAPYLDALFSSLEQTTYSGAWSILIVDNASQDTTRDRLHAFRSAHPSRGLSAAHGGVTVIESDVNVGYAAGMNIGMTHAMQRGAESVVLLNQDTVVDPNWLTELMRAAESDPTIGAVQARIMLEQERTKINSVGNSIHYLGFAFTSGNGQKWKPGARRQTSGIVDITYPSGAAVLLRVKALDDIGLFDPSYFMYHEDVDMGWRLWRAGWRVILAPDAVVYHKFEFSRSIKKYYWMERNRIRVLFENYSLRALFLIAPALIVMEIGMVPFGIVKGWWREKLKVYFWFLRPSSWFLIAESRHAKQKKFRRPERELLDRFVGAITDQEVENSLLKYIANPLFSAYWNVVRRIL